MTNTKTTKRALLSSIVAMFLCFAMLIGTTYAWFTDSVTSANNVIQSGNLDVVLEYKTNWSDEWATVDENTKLFKDGALYEPGYTEVVYLRVSNAGSLALKYLLSFNIANEEGSVNVYGEEFKLSDYLQVGTYVQDEYSSGFNYADILMPAMFETREAALNSVDLQKLSEADAVIRENAPILPGDDTAQVIALVLTMPEAVGNEANAKPGEDAPYIELGINVLATQFTYESDSFDNQYDAGAEYDEGLITDAAALKAALEAGEDVKLGADITMTDVNRSFVTMDNVGEVTLDLNGYTLSAVSHGYNDTALIIKNGTTLTITGNGKFIYGTAFATLGADSKLIIENGSIDADDTVTCETGNYAIICLENSTVEIEGGTIDIVLKCTDGCNWIGELTNKIGSVNINGGIFVGIAPPSASVADGATVTSEVVNGSTVYTVTSAN